MKKFVTLLISDTQGVFEVLGRKEGLGSIVELEVDDKLPKENWTFMKRNLKNWLDWAEYQIKNWPQK